MSRPTLDNDRSQSRRAKPQLNRRFARIAAVTTLAALAFVAGLQVDTTVILRFIFSCAIGGCWRVPFWASIVAVAFFAVAVIVYFQLSRGPKHPLDTRHPAIRETLRGIARKS